MTAEIRTCPLRLTYDTQVRRGGEGEEVENRVWLAEVEVLRFTLKPWRPISDWLVDDAESAVRILRLYC